MSVPGTPSVEGFDASALRRELSKAVVKRSKRWQEWVRITPALAADLLKRFNLRNRRVSKESVSKYAGDMLRGDWIETGEPCIITENGWGLSFQHRLLACVKSGEEFVTLMVVGVPDRAADIIDGGRAKSFPDRRHIAGLPGNNSVGSSISWKCRYDMNAMDGGSVAASISDLQRKAKEAEHPGLVELARQVPRAPIGWGGSAIWYWLFYEFSMRDAALAEGFAIRQVMNGLGVEENSNAFYLRRWLERNAIQGGGRKAGYSKSNYVAAVIVKSWNAERLGKLNRSPKWGAREPFPEIK